MHDPRRAGQDASTCTHVWESHSHARAMTSRRIRDDLTLVAGQLTCRLLDRFGLLSGEVVIQPQHQEVGSSRLPLPTGSSPSRTRHSHWYSFGGQVIQKDSTAAIISSGTLWRRTPTGETVLLGV